MDNRQNQNWKLGFGLLAGAVLGYWLNSDKGRRVRTEIQKNAVEYGEQVSGYMAEQANQVSRVANQYYEQGIQAIDNATSTVKQTLINQTDQVADKAEEVVETAESNLKSGFNRARHNVQNGVEAVG